MTERDQRVTIHIKGSVLSDPEAASVLIDEIKKLFDGDGLVFIETRRLDIWRTVRLWKSRTMPWPSAPLIVAPDHAWEAYYRERANTSVNKLELARDALRAVLRHWEEPILPITQAEIDTIREVLEVTGGSNGEAPR